jgi:hypothetical protein
VGARGWFCDPGVRETCTTPVIENSEPDFRKGSWSCENGSAEGDRRRQAQLSMLSQLRAGFDVVCPVRPERSGGADALPTRTPHVWIASMSGFTPRMFMTRVRL